MCEWTKRKQFFFLFLFSLHSIVSSRADGISAAESAAAVAVVGRAALLPAGALVVARAR